MEIKYQWQALFLEKTILQNQVPRKSTDESADDAADNNDVDGEDDDCDEVHGGRLHLKNWQTFNLSPAWLLCTRVDDCHVGKMEMEKPLLPFQMKFPFLKVRQCSILIKREAPEHSKTIQVANFNIPGNPI